MTISSTSSVTSYNGDGIVVAFSTVYEFAQDSDLSVVLVNSAGVGTVQTITTHYTVSGSGLPGGGTVTMVTAPASGETLKLHRWVDPTQDSNYIANDPLSSEVLENDFDKVIMITQQILDRIGGTSFSAELFDFLARNPSNLNEWDADSLVLANLAAPVDPNDATTKTYVDGISVAAGNLPTGDPVNNFLVSNASNYVTNTPANALVAIGAQGLDAQLTDIAGLTPAKGSIVASTASNLALEAVGSNDEVFTADSSKTNGVKWIDTRLPSGWNTIGTTRENAQDIAFSAGVARDSSDTNNIKNTAVLTKRIDANWTAGDDAGGFPSTLTLANNTTYHCFIILKTSDGSVDAGFDTSITAANLLSDSGYNKYFLVWSVTTTSATPTEVITDYLQDGPWCWLGTVQEDFSEDDPNDVAVTYTLSTPAGRKLVAIGIATLVDATSASDARWLVSSLDQADIETTASVNQLEIAGSGTVADGSESMIMVRTNTSSQIRGRMDNSRVGEVVSFKLIGWYDSSGRNA